ncbi:hypothetical protein HNP82_002319 [Catenibacillus scindens]|uniref:Uncharacterized protein n=1 Tax=Catenibacillus scindens TaxID=673271 RepID=A0A7W8M5L4_9FIRM|nr:hypothetical protein [Catenibacillus scindens]
MMRPQRVREGESRMEMQVAKWTAEGAVNGKIFLIILRRGAYVSCRRYVSISLRVRLIRKSRWHRGRSAFASIVHPSLT